MAKEKKSPKDSKNWKLLSKRTYDETLQNRDVYDTQQLKRGTLGNVQTFTVRHIIAITVGVLVLFFAWMIYSMTDISVLQKKADEEASRVMPITEHAPEQPRQLKPVQWLNLTLVERDKYKEFGYMYADYATKSYYTQAEYEIWCEINAKFDARSETADHYPEIWRRSDGVDYYYVERPYIADPSAEPREFSLAEYANMTMKPCHSGEDNPLDWRCYHDKGYFYKDYTYERYMTQTEYDRWQEVQTHLDQYIESGQIICYADIPDKSELAHNGSKYPYLMPSDIEGLNDEIVTEDAGSRVTTPISLSDIEWANMDLVSSTKYANFRYKYADRRTGKYYTEPEYIIWANIQSKIANRVDGYIFWREKNEEYGGFNYFLEPPEYAPAEERDLFKAFTDVRLMTLNLVPGERWKAWGYNYADSNTASYVTEAEYKRWKDVQDRVERGELNVPDSVAGYIRANNLTVTDVIANAMPVPPQKIGLNDALVYFHWMKFLISFAFGGAAYGILREILKRNLKAQNAMEETEDINQYENDQHIAMPEEVMRKFDWFADAGAHCPVSVSSMVSHVMLNNKGLNPVQIAKRAKEDIYDDDGNLLYYKGEILLDNEGQPLTETVPLIDEEFGDALFETSGNPKEVCKKYSTVKLPYNPGGKDRDKLKYNTVAEMINAEWKYPIYEPQRPAGAYLVDTAPVNTMVLAMTRAGKGQTVIEPTIDMWMRELRPNNMVINDPKGELLVKNYVRGTVRGFNIVQFNLINAMKTDIYNPLGMAADSAREGDFTKCAMYVDNVATVFFPVDGADDPVWPNAANNAFKRAAYGLMDAYLEDEIDMRLRAEKTGRDQKSLERDIDRMWGRMTLYNCYQMFVNLTSKKKKNPNNVFLAAQEEAGKIQNEVNERNKNKAPGEPKEKPKSAIPEVQALFDMDDAEYAAHKEKVKRLSVLWDDKPEADLLTLYFNATDALPRNSMRVLVSNANNALKSMAGAEKMMASVYGIAITAMSFFVDPTIATLTSGTPTQNVDLAGLSFPRRLGVRFHNDFLKQNHLIGLQIKWSAYNDPEFKEDLGKLFTHEDLITREGWAKYYFEGIFPNEKAYIKMQIKNTSTDQLVREMFFVFEKSYQTSLDGRFFVKDPVLSERIVKNGILTELKPQKDPETGKMKYVPGKTTFKRNVIDFSNPADLSPKRKDANAIIRYMTRYAEKPKMVFLVTPPHLMNYAKLILILVKQLVDLNFDQSYMTKSTQKPLYKTRFMLDELGNLQSEGHGIAGFETMLSIGLGQEQQFTLILQTLQQLKDVYGDSVDKIVQGNAQPFTSRIATPNGWMLMGDIKVGDEVLTPFGTVTKITGVYPKGIRPVYRVTLRDGSTAEACNEHLWQIERWKSSIKYTGGKDENGKRKYIGTGPNGETAVRVEEIVNSEELKIRVEKGEQISLPSISPVVYSEADLPIDPYVLGVILGDGCIVENGSVTIICGDTKMPIIEEVKWRGYEISERSAQEGKSQVYGLLGVSDAVRQLDLAGKHAWEKFIPEIYLYSSVEQRLDLLRGLMDTDGTISDKNEIEFSSSSRELAEGVQQLVRSLGGRVSLNTKDKVMFTSPNQLEPKQARPAYRVQNICLQKINPFLLPRKADKWIERNDNSGNRVVSVDYIRDEEVQCIRIADERHLYLTDDYMPTHNTSNIVFLKSTDDSMLDTLQKMSGVTHKTYRDSKTITRDAQKLMMQNEGKISYTVTTKEVPVITYNDMAFINERNSMLFRAGDAPVWNRNECILPMSWRLFKNTIEHPGKTYTLQTIPTLSSAIDFDLKGNQPDFEKMLDKRMEQAAYAPIAMDLFQKSYKYSDSDIVRLDIDAYSKEIMEMINDMIWQDVQKKAKADALKNGNVEDITGDVNPDNFNFGNTSGAVDNKDVQATIAQQQAFTNERKAGIFAGGHISKESLIPRLATAHSHRPTHNFDRDFIDIFRDIHGAMFADKKYFTDKDGDLLGADGRTVYIRKKDARQLQTEEEELEEINKAAKDKNSSVYAAEEMTQEGLNKAMEQWEVTDAFYYFLESLSSWDFADGRFEQEMTKKCI